MRWGLRGRIWWIIRRRTSSIGALDEEGNFEWVVLRTRNLKKDGWKTRSGGPRRGGLLRQAEFPDLREERRGRGRFGWWTKGRTAGETRSACRCSRLRIPEGLWLLNRAGSAATGAFQQIERAGVGADDGAVRDAGGVFGSRVEPDGGRELLHPAGAGGQVRMDGAGGEGLSDRGGQSEAAAGGDLPGVLSGAGGRVAGPGRADNRG